ncbi:disabled homolog 2-like [Solea solea]|uniref:disabled homolog 2-like n=1 Tax=Solea solea TaxID=90069 RepID=UPI00272B7426|nr:disabled homolog 2-like [Solea solea]XP_058494743.1 disabled homolog 2-like [Solea solea]
MMETEQMTGSCPAPSQAAVRPWLSSSARGATRTPGDTADRFHGDGVRYKAKLIGVDPVSDSQGDKMCWDSMMKLKGIEVASRKQGKHKPRVWLKVFSTGLKILDERTGAVLHDHERSRISSLTKDESDPRALAYIYQHQDSYSLFYIKMANLADSVLADIKEVCQRLDQETPQEPAEAPTQMSTLLPIDESSAVPLEGPDLESVFSPRPDSSSGEINQVSSSNELMDVFSVQMREPLSPTEGSCISQTDSPQPRPQPQPMLSSSQIMSMFPTQPLVGSPYSSPPYSPSAMPWGHALGNQWAAPPMAPWPNIAGVTALAAGSHGMMTSQPCGVMWAGNTPASPTPVSGFPNTVNSSGAQQSAAPSVDNNLLL